MYALDHILRIDFWEFASARNPGSWWSQSNISKSHLCTGDTDAGSNKPISRSNWTMSYFWDYWHKWMLNCTCQRYHHNNDNRRYFDISNTRRCDRWLREKPLIEPNELSFYCNLLWKIIQMHLKAFWTLLDWFSAASHWLKWMETDSCRLRWFSVWVFYPSSKR